MKIVAGIDHVVQGELLLKAIHDLDFTAPHLKFVNVIEVWVDPGTTQFGIDVSPYNMEAYFNRAQRDAHDILDQVQTSAKQQGFNDSSKQVLYGHITNQILDYADAEHANLLAFGSTDKGTVEGILIGSVGRKAVINAKRSVLIVKESYKADKDNLSIVLATDHSPYANNWLNRFLEWRPRGIRHITVVTVIPEQLESSLTASRYFKADANQLIQDGLEEANERMLNKLSILRADCRSRVERGAVGDTLARIMEETQADLLVLGSQGHGFMERLTVGSVSLDQAVNRPYSVLLVRV